MQSNLFLRRIAVLKQLPFMFDKMITQNKNKSELTAEVAGVRVGT